MRPSALRLSQLIQKKNDHERIIRQNIEADPFAIMPGEITDDVHKGFIIANIKDVMDFKRNILSGPNFLEKEKAIYILEALFSRFGDVRQVYEIKEYSKYLIDMSDSDEAVELALNSGEKTMIGTHQLFCTKKRINPIDRASLLGASH